MEVVDLGVGDAQFPEEFPGVLAMPRRVGAPARAALPETEGKGRLGNLLARGKGFLKPGSLVKDVGVLKGLFERVDRSDADRFRIKEPEPFAEGCG